MPSGPERSFVDDTKLYISFLAHWANAVGDLNVDLLHIRKSSPPES